VARIRGVAGGEMYYLDEEGEQGKLVFSPHTYKEKSMQVLPKEERPFNSSLEIWGPLSEAIAEHDLKTADKIKREIEQNQRKIRKEREEKGEQHIPRFFGQKYGTWLYKFPTVQIPTKSDLEAQKN